MMGVYPSLCKGKRQQGNSSWGAASTPEKFEAEVLKCHVEPRRCGQYGFTLWR